MKMKKSGLLIPLFATAILFFIIGFFVGNVVLNSGNNPPSQVSFVIKNDSQQPITRLKIQSELGTSDYAVTIAPGKTIEVPSYSNGEDSPQIQLIFSDGDILNSKTYVESGSTIKMKIVSPDKIQYCYSNNWDKCS